MHLNPSQFEKVTHGEVRNAFMIVASLFSGLFLFSSKSRVCILSIRILSFS